MMENDGIMNNDNEMACRLVMWEINDDNNLCLCNAYYEELYVMIIMFCISENEVLLWWS